MKDSSLSSTEFDSIVLGPSGLEMTPSLISADSYSQRLTQRHDSIMMTSFQLMKFDENQGQE